ncbi:hypothetical protein DYH09_13480 [bacterium CPR1]|nr:hypothetical protein [bacterium CPR1]
MGAEVPSDTTWGFAAGLLAKVEQQAGAAVLAQAAYRGLQFALTALQVVAGPFFPDTGEVRSTVHRNGLEQFYSRPAPGFFRTPAGAPGQRLVPTLDAACRIKQGDPDRNLVEHALEAGQILFERIVARFEA